MVFSGVVQSVIILKSVMSAFGFSFLLYYLEFLPSGDAKLIASLSLFIPPSVYSESLAGIPSLTFFVNAFLPLSVALLIFLIVKTPRKIKKESLKRVLDPKALGSRFLKIFSLSGLSGFLLSFVGLNRLFLASGIFIVGLMTIIDRLFKDTRIPYAITFVITLFLTLDSFIASVYLSLFTFALYGILRFFVMEMANSFFARRISLKNLEPGMVPADSIYYDEKREFYVKKPEKDLTIFSPIRRIGKGDLLICKNEGLSEQEIENIKKLHKKHLTAFSSIRIHETFPLAPFVLLGYILTYLVGGESFSFLISLI